VCVCLPLPQAQDSAGPDDYSPAMRYIEVPDNEADPGNARAYWFTNLDSYANATLTAGNIVSCSDIPQYRPPPGGPFPQEKPPTTQDSNAFPVGCQEKNHLFCFGEVYHFSKKELRWE